MSEVAGSPRESAVSLCVLALAVSLSIGVFAPSSPFPRDRFDAGLARLQALGLSVRVHPQADARKGFLAGEDSARRQAFFDLMQDEEVGAVIAARGGYGAHRWLRGTDFSAAGKKPLVGFSDVCAIHSALALAGGRPIHGPVVTQLGDLDEKDLEHLRDLLIDPAPFTLTAEATIQSGQVEGPLAGGCLSVIAPLVGTPHLYLPEGAILMLEEVGEAPYRVDRMLTHLLNAGVLDRVGGVAVGDMVGCRPPREGEQTVEDVLEERLGRLSVPVVRGLPFGHGGRNLAWPVGSTAVLDAGARALTVTP